MTAFCFIRLRQIWRRDQSPVDKSESTEYFYKVTDSNATNRRMVAYLAGAYTYILYSTFYNITKLRQGALDDEDLEREGPRRRFNQLLSTVLRIFLCITDASRSRLYKRRYCMVSNFTLLFIKSPPSHVT